MQRPRSAGTEQASATSASSASATPGSTIRPKVLLKLAHVHKEKDLQEIAEAIVAADQALTGRPALECIGLVAPGVGAFRTVQAMQ